MQSHLSPFAIQPTSVKGIGEGHFHTMGRVCVCVCQCVFERVLVFVCGVGAVAKGMPWLRGASQPADGVSLEVAAPLSFIRGDRPR